MNTKSGCILHTYVCMHWVWAIRYYFTWSILLQAMTHLIIFLSIFVFALFRHICVCFVLCYWSVFFLLFIHLFTSLVFVPFLIIAFLIQWFYLVEQVWVWCWRKYLFAWFFSLLSMCINIFFFFFCIRFIECCMFLVKCWCFYCMSNESDREKKIVSIEHLKSILFSFDEKEKETQQTYQIHFFLFSFLLTTCYKENRKKISTFNCSRFSFNSLLLLHIVCLP